MSITSKESSLKIDGDHGCYEIEDGEILGAIRTVTFEFGYVPPIQGDRWHPAYDATVEITKIEALRWVHSDYLPDGRYWPHDDEVRTEITNLFSRKEIEKFEQEILEEIEDARKNRRKAA
jgi:hypothetical protein